MPGDALEREALRYQAEAGNRSVSALVALQRQQGGAAGRPPQAAARRPEYVFVMGPRRDGFYRLAARYFRTTLPQAVVVTDVRTLDGVLSHLEGLPNAPIGAIYLVSHANEDGDLGFALDDADAAAHRGRRGGRRRQPSISFAELRDGVGQLVAGHQLGRRIDAQTWIHIKGCNIGRSRAMLELVDRAFTGAGRVSAPTHRQGYRRRGRGPVTEFHDRYVLEFPGSHRMSRRRVIAALRQRYPNLAVRRARRFRRRRRNLTTNAWAAEPRNRRELRAVVPRNQRGRFRNPRLTRRVEGNERIVRWTWHTGPRRFTYREWRYPTAAVAEAQGRATRARPNAWSWSVRFAGRGRRRQLVVVATKTEYVVRGQITDARGRAAQPGVGDATFFGTTN